jgi:hypothetical protein
MQRGTSATGVTRDASRRHTAIKIGDRPSHTLHRYLLQRAFSQRASLRPRSWRYLCAAANQWGSRMQYGYWQKKPEFLGSGIVLATLIAPLDRFPAEFSAREWEYQRAVMLPDPATARDIRLRGYSLREVSAEDAERAGRMHRQQQQQA